MAAVEFSRKYCGSGIHGSRKDEPIKSHAGAMRYLRQQMLHKTQLRFLGIVAALLLAPALSATAAGQKCFICIKPVVDMPVIMEKGTVRSPEFTVKHKLYIIKLQADNALPSGQLDCLMGVYLIKAPDHCEMFNFHLAFEAEWKLYAGTQVVAHGIVQGRDGNYESDNHQTSRWFASFTGEKNKKYVLEVTFTKDGSALRVANPHIVIDLTPGSLP
jgi:hypothetical protein